MRRQFSFAAATLVVFLAGCGSASSPSPAGSSPTGSSPGSSPAGSAASPATASKPLRIITAEPTTGIDPAVAVTSASLRPMELIYDQLIDYDEKGGLVPDLAESWDVSPDGLTYTFHLQPNAKFSDGTPVTGDDVKFSVERMAASEVLKSSFAVMEDITVVDPQTVTITLSQPARVFLNALARVGTSAILSKKAVEADPNYFTKPTATSGPWQLQEWIPKDHMTFVANPNYWNTGYPLIPEIDYTFSEDPTTSAAALESGTEDMSFPMAPIDAQRLEGEGKVNLFQPYTATVLAWGLDRTKPPFSDVNVRQAVAYMVPRDNRYATCWRNTGGVSYGAIILDGSWAYTPGIEMYKLPQAEAIQKATGLLDQSGWVEGPDGVRVSKGVAGVPDGTRFEVDVPFENNWSQARCNTELLANDLKAVGIAINPRAYEPANFYPDASAGKFAMWHGAGPSWATVDDMMSQGFTSSGLANSYLCKLESGSPVDPLIDQAVATSDLNQAKDLYAQAQQILANDAFCLPTGYQASIIVTTPNVKGYVPRADQSNRSLIKATVE